LKNKVILVLLIGIILSLLVVSMPLTGCGTVMPQAESIKIGVLGPTDYDFGKLILYGGNIAADEINAAGGISLSGVKRPAKIIGVNTNEMTSATDTIAAVEKAIVNDKVNCLIGGYRLEAVLDEQDKAMDLNTIFISSGNNEPEQSVKVKKDYARYKYWFRTNLNAVYCATYYNIHAGFIADILRKELGIQDLKAAIIADKATYADPLVNIWSKSLPEMGIKIAGVFRPMPTATDITSEIKGIKDSGAQIVMQMLTERAGLIFAKQWVELQIPCVALGINIPAQPKSIWETTNGKVEYITTGVISPNAEMTSKTIPFFNKFHEKYKEYPMYASTSYDAVWIYKNAVEKSGTLDSDDLVTTMEKTDHIGATYRIIFGDMNTPFPHDVLSSQTKGYAYIPMVQWIKGEQVCVWPPEIKGARKYQIPPWMLKFYKN
jgi:branched-chain amino acid transport system substrate-binding protein